jgi:hypothetical protein
VARRSANAGRERRDRNRTARAPGDPRPDGSFLEIGGKTGTGDHRHHRWGARGQHLGSEARARTATFAFFLGDRFFGVATAYVSGPEAGRYEFTSALAVELVRSLAPVLEPLVARENAPGGSLPAQGA